MLVRILSNIASVLGNARSRAVLASCFVMLLATSSVVGILAMHDGVDKSAASSTTETDQKTKQQDTIWLNERAEEVESVDSQSTDNTKQEQSNTSDREKTSDHNKDANQSNPTTVEQSSPKLAISTESTTVTTDSISNVITVNIDGDNQNNSWLLTIDNENEASGLTITDINSKNNTLTFRVLADKSIKPGTYQVKVNAAQSQDNAPILYQTLTVTVTEKQQ